jgi:hypothetical protein
MTVPLSFQYPGSQRALAPLILQYLPISTMRLKDEQIQGYAEAVPAAWRKENDFCDQMVEYLAEARKHRETLIQFIKHLLR